MKTLVRGIAKDVLRKAGFELRRSVDNGVPVTSDARRMAMMRHNDITVVVDVGAHVGEYASGLRRSGYTKRIISLEPTSAAFQALQRASQGDENWDALNMAAGDKDGEAEINIAGNSFSSSLLPMLDKHLQSAPESKYVAAERVKVRTLDSVLPDKLKSGDRVMLKMDTQGYEHRVLEGASSVLRQVRLIECELSLAPLYEGQYLFLEMIEILAKAGFKPVNFEPLFIEPSTGYCLQLDGVFART